MHSGVKFRSKRFVCNNLLSILYRFRNPRVPVCSNFQNMLPVVSRLSCLIFTYWVVKFYWRPLSTIVKVIGRAGQVAMYLAHILFSCIPAGYWLNDTPYHTQINQQSWLPGSIRIRWDFNLLGFWLSRHSHDRTRGCMRYRVYTE